MTGAAPHLQATEAWLQASLMAQQAPPAGAVAERLLDREGFAACEGLAIYRRAYLARISGAMRAQFPALCHALGEPLFNEFAKAFVHEQPPQSYTLYDLGRRFADYLENQRPDRGKAGHEREIWIDFMIDLARFEYRLFQLYDAPGAEGMRMAVPDTGDDRLRLQPAITLGRHRFNVAPYYHAVRREQPVPTPDEGENFLVLVRTDYIVRTIPLRAWEFAILEAMQPGHTLAAAIPLALERLAVPAQDRNQAYAAIRSARPNWMAWGLFVEG
ncbi:MAG: DNA-binding domain-containing protein [Novosphingobium sp.]